ncbi:hypothetical protein D3C86_2186650 [compost metagenome]
MLAAGAHAALHGGGARIRAAIQTQEHVLELDHAGVGQQHGRVIAWHQRAGPDDRVTLGLEEFKELLADFR